MNETDADLISKAVMGDRTAFGSLVDRYRQYVFRTAFGILNRHDDAQDVTQEVFVYAYQHLPHLRDRKRFGGWLRTITFSLSAEYHRRRGTRSLGLPLSTRTEIMAERDLVLSMTLQKAIRQLSEAHQLTFRMRYVGGWSEQEVATLLNLSVNTVRSRLRAAKRHLRKDLSGLIAERIVKQPMSLLTTATALTTQHTDHLYRCFPNAQLREVQPEPEAWMPTTFRLKIETAEGEEVTVDFRNDLTPERLPLLEFLAEQGIPMAKRLSEPEQLPNGEYITLAKAPQGENLLEWALGGTPHRLRIATERGLEGIDRLESLTSALEQDPVGKALPRYTLQSEIEAIRTKGGEHLQDAWFTERLALVEAATGGVECKLVYTHYLHFFPNWLRVQTEPDDLNEPMGFPGDARLKQYPITEYIAPYGHFGDPLLGVAMVWIYDCYPIVHAGFVEQYLWRKGVSKREFAPRLALQSLKITQRELPAERPDTGEEARYYDALRGYVELALSWLR
jgi:RNA polymerase sigma-70 factor (ECF subfamily)